MSKEQKKREDGFEHLEEALTSGEQFIEKNQKMIVNVVLVLVVIIAGYFGYNRFIAEPHAQEAANQIFGAQNYFEKDSFNLALNGDAYMQLGEYRKAAENYKKAAASKTNDFSTPTFLMKNGLALEKSNDYSGALKVYEQIEQEYPASPEGRDIEKYIERAQLKLKK